MYKLVYLLTYLLTYITNNLMCFGISMFGPLCVVIVFHFMWQSWGRRKFIWKTLRLRKKTTKTT